MTAIYLVNLGVVQLYFDAEMHRCKPPGSRPAGQVQTIHFVQVDESGQLLDSDWDIHLAEFTAAQREHAKLYKKTEP